jgi:hypothetical protein
MSSASARRVSARIRQRRAGLSGRAAGRNVSVAWIRIVQELPGPGCTDQRLTAAAMNRGIPAATS